MPLEREAILGRVVAQLAHALHDMVGAEQADAFIGLVGERIGRDIDRVYRDALGLDELDRETVVPVLLDLLGRMGGASSLVDEGHGRLVFRFALRPLHGRAAEHRRNAARTAARTREPDEALGVLAAAMAQVIVADNLGYAHVTLGRCGDGECELVVQLSPPVRERDRCEAYAS